VTDQILRTQMKSNQIKSTNESIVQFICNHYFICEILTVYFDF